LPRTISNQNANSSAVQPAEPFPGHVLSQSETSPLATDVLSLAKKEKSACGPKPYFMLVDKRPDNELNFILILP
jgi:hypothetical protein